MRIGIPRAFYYYNYPGLWETFFRRIGHEPVVSGTTTQRILAMAAQASESENCLPHKIFDGHVMSLLPGVDAVFIPRLLSMLKHHICCPRFGALPDASRAGVAFGHQIISIDINETREPLQKSLVRLGTTLGVGRAAAKQAAIDAMAEMKRLQQAEFDKEQAPSPERRFLVLGHPYTLGDPFISGPVFAALSRLGVAVERMTFDKEELTPGEVLWCTFHRMLRRLETIDMNTTAGVIQISTFNCGADSMMTERFRRMCVRNRVPWMLLTLDEHTGRAGLDTRIEAFVDSLSWQGRTSFRNQTVDPCVCPRTHGQGSGIDI